MALVDDLNSYVTDIFSKANWQVRIGQVVPQPKDLKAGNDAVEFERVTVLYADLSGSTSMVDGRKWHFAAEVYKNFLYCAARLITDSGGTITAYDGDRVMGVFVGSVQSNPAAKCGLKINYAVKSIITPAMKKQYPETNFVLRHVVGIDTSAIRVAKTGVRGDNDLVWVGRAANYAAKLTEHSADYPTWITAAMYSQLDEDMKNHGNPKKAIWEKRTWTPMNNMEIYCSNWTWSF